MCWNVRDPNADLCVTIMLLAFTISMILRSRQVTAFVVSSSVQQTLLPNGTGKLLLQLENQELVPSRNLIKTSATKAALGLVLPSAPKREVSHRSFLRKVQLSSASKTSLTSRP